MAHFTFKRAFAQNNSRKQESTNSPNRIQTSGPAESSENTKFSLSHKSSPALRETGDKTFKFQSMSPLHRYDRPLEADTSTSAEDPASDGHPDRYVAVGQSSPQLQSNLSYAKDVSGFMRPDLSGPLQPRFSDRGSTEHWHRSSPELPSGVGITHDTSRTSLGSAAGDADNDDISVMLRGVTDLRNMRIQMEDQRRRVTVLESQLKAAQVDNNELLQKIKTVKDAANEGYQKSAASLESLGESLKALQAQSQEWSRHTEEIRSSMPVVQEIRQTVLEATTAITPLLENETTVQTRNIIQELQSECANSQQVTDMLRERLTSLSSELVDARCRITDLENMQFDDREVLKQTANSLSVAHQTIVELSNSIKGQRREVSDALASAVELEAKLVAACQRNSELESQLTDDGERRTAEAFGLQSELADLNKRLQLRETELITLKSRTADKEDNIKNLNAALSKAESKIEQVHECIAALQKEVGTIGIREERALQAKAQITSEKNMLERRNSDLGNQLQETKTELDQFRETVQSMNTKYQVLHERFDDQSVTLRITKEANGDLQERMMASETSFTRNIEVIKDQHRCEIISLEEQRASLQSTVDQYLTQLERQEESSRIVKADFEKRLSEQETDANARIHIEEQKGSQVQVELKKLSESFEKLKQHAVEKEEQLSNAKHEVTRKDERLLDMEREVARKDQQLSNTERDVAWKDEQLSNAERDVARKDEHLSNAEREVARMAQQIAHMGEEITQRDLAIQALRGDNEGIRILQVERDELMNRAKGISERYAKGDLSEEEKAFITDLMESDRTEHQKDLALKANEIRRRDTTIQNLQSMVKTLEAARYTKAPSALKEPTAARNVSLIDWTSGHSSPPTNAPDRDAPSLAEDLAPTAKPIAPLHALPLCGKSDVMKRVETPLQPPHGELIATSVKARMNPSSAVVKDSSKTDGISFMKIADQSDDDQDLPNVIFSTKTALGKRNRGLRLMNDNQEHTTDERANAERPTRKQVSATSVLSVIESTVRQKAITKKETVLPETGLSKVTDTSSRMSRPGPRRAR